MATQGPGSTGMCRLQVSGIPSTTLLFLFTWAGRFLEGTRKDRESSMWAGRAESEITPEKVTDS